MLCHLVGFPVSDLGKKQRTMPLQLPYQLLAPKTCTTSVKDTVSSKASHESQVKSDTFDFLLSSTVYLNSSLVRVSVEFDRWKARIPEDSSWFPRVHWKCNWSERRLQVTNLSCLNIPFQQSLKDSPLWHLVISGVVCAFSGGWAMMNHAMPRQQAARNGKKHEWRSCGPGTESVVKCTA